MSENQFSFNHILTLCPTDQHLQNFQILQGIKLDLPNIYTAVYFLKFGRAISTKEHLKIDFYVFLLRRGQKVVNKDKLLKIRGKS